MMYGEYPAIHVQITQFVSKAMGVSERSILSDCKPREFVRARWVIWRAIHELRPNYSSVRIGQLFNRDHSTVLHGLNAILAHDDLMKLVDECKREFGAVQDPPPPSSTIVYFFPKAA